MNDIIAMFLMILSIILLIFSVFWIFYYNTNNTIIIVFSLGILLGIIACALFIYIRSLKIILKSN